MSKSEAADGSEGAEGLGPAGVLICDDNEAMRALLTALIGTSLSMQVVGEAADGNEAIAEAQRLQPDVVLLDLAMPNRSGLESIREIRHVAPRSQIVVLSGFASATVADEVIALGAVSYIEKGAHPDTIVATIEEALARLQVRPSIGVGHRTVRPQENGRKKSSALFRRTEA